MLYTRARRTKLAVSGVLFAAATSLCLVVACTDDPTSAVLLPWVQADGLAGADTTTACELSANGTATEWGYVAGHLVPDSVDPYLPTRCWEYEAGDTFTVDVKFAFEDDHYPNDDYFVMDLMKWATDEVCQSEPDTATTGRFIKRLGNVENDPLGKSHRFTFSGEDSVKIPSGARCVLIGVKAEGDTIPSLPENNYDLYLRVWVKLDADAPTSFTAVRTGNNIDLEWTNQENMETSIQRRLVQPSSTDWAEIEYVLKDSTDYTDTRSQADAGKTFRYRVQHRQQSDLEDTARLGDASDSVDVAMPSDVTTSINTGPTSVKPNQYCTWSTSTSGGTTPYDYAWSGGASGTSTDYLGALSSSATLIFTATDDIGWVDADSLAVSVSSRAANCPGAVFSSITGPTTVREDQECLWLGGGSGGTTPYSYEWSGDASGSSTSFQGSFSSAATLIFTVTDDIGRIAVDTIQVTIDPGADECEIK